MFTRKSVTKLKQQKSIFPLTNAQIEEDIEAIMNSSENRAKLFTSINDKVPPDESCIGLEEYLRGTSNLEHIQLVLQGQAKKLELLAEQLRTGMSEINNKLNSFKQC